MPHSTAKDNKTAERWRMKQERARLAALVESSEDAITAVTLDGIFVSWNRSAERLYGYAASEIIGQHVSVLAPPTEKELVMGVIARFQRGEMVEPLEVSRARRDGRQIEVSLSFSPIHDGDEQMIGLSCISRDITERRRAETALADSEARLRRLSDAAFEGIAVSRNGILLDVNTAFAEMFGYASVDEMLGMDALELVAPDGRALTRQKVAENDEALYETVLVRRDTTTFPAEVRGRRITYGDQPARVTAVRDMTQQKALENALRESQRFAQSIADQSTSIIYVFDLATLSNVYSNRSVSDFLGYSPDEVQRLGDALLPAMLHPDDLSRVLGHFSVFAATADGEVVEIEYRARGADGQWRWIWSREVVFQRRPDGTAWQIMGTAQDITERKAAEQALHDSRIVLEFQKAELERANAELAALAVTDGLTGLHNHRAFQERLAEEVARAGRYAAPLSVVLLDVDNFKRYNDAFGHPAGDRVLRRVAHILQDGIRETDLAARYGGEEFALILPQTDGSGAWNIAERLRRAIENVCWLHHSVTASFGIASLGLGSTGGDLIAQADRALYQSKRDGRNRVAMADAQPMLTLPASNPAKEANPGSPSERLTSAP